MGVGFNRKTILRSWDKFEIPKPFAKAEVLVSEIIYIDNELDYDGTNKMILMCEDKLNELNKKAENLCSN